MRCGKIANESTIQQSSNKIVISNYGQSYNNEKPPYHEVEYKMPRHEEYMKQFNWEN